MQLTWIGRLNIELVNGETREITVVRTIWDGQGHVLQLITDEEISYNYNNIISVKEV